MKIKNLNPVYGVAERLYHSFLAYQPPERRLGSGFIEPPTGRETKKPTWTYSTGVMSVVVSEAGLTDSKRSIAALTLITVQLSSPRVMMAEMMISSANSLCLMCAPFPFSFDTSN